MKFEELKEKTDEELKKMLSEEQEKLRQLHFRASARELKNIREIRLVKKNIAQILTRLKRLAK